MSNSRRDFLRAAVFRAGVWEGFRTVQTIRTEADTLHRRERELTYLRGQFPIDGYEINNFDKLKFAITLIKQELVKENRIHFDTSSDNNITINYLFSFIKKSAKTLEVTLPLNDDYKLPDTMSLELLDIILNNISLKELEIPIYAAPAPKDADKRSPEIRAPIIPMT